MSDILALAVVLGLIYVIVFGPEVKPTVSAQEMEDGAKEYNSRNTLPGHPPTCDCPGCEGLPDPTKTYNDADVQKVNRAIFAARPCEHGMTILQVDAMACAALEAMGYKPE